MGNGVYFFRDAARVLSLQYTLGGMISKVAISEPITSALKQRIKQLIMLATHFQNWYATKCCNSNIKCKCFMQSVLWESLAVRTTRCSGV